MLQAGRWHSWDLAARAKCDFGCSKSRNCLIFVVSQGEKHHGRTGQLVVVLADVPEGARVSTGGGKAADGPSVVKCGVLSESTLMITAQDQNWAHFTLDNL